MQKTLLTCATLMMINIDIYANNLQDTFEHAQYEGLVRLGYQNHHVNQTTKDESAIGITLHMETASYYGLQVGTTLITSQGNGKSDFEGVPFFDENNNNYTTLTESYLKGTYGNTTFTLGRQTLDTPFADSDDIGMVPNTFEAYTLVNTSIKDTSIFFSHVKKWSGVDSDAPSSFSKINTNKGMQILGLSYAGLNKVNLSAWFYNLSDEVQITYLEANYQDETEQFSYAASIQYAFQDYDNADSSTVYGAALSLGVKHIGLTSTVSYNTTRGIAADNFFGGGPFFTNAEHYTLKKAGPDGNTILYTLEWDASVIGLEGLSVTGNIDGHTGKGKYASEYDIGVEYTYSDSIQISAIYSDIDDAEASFTNLRVFLNYAF